MSERYRQHEQTRRDFWAQALLNGATKYDPINKGYSHQYHVMYADMLLAEYDKKFPEPIEGLISIRSVRSFVLSFFSIFNTDEEIEFSSSLPFLDIESRSSNSRRATAVSIVSRNLLRAL